MRIFEEDVSQRWSLAPKVQSYYYLHLGPLTLAPSQNMVKGVRNYVFTINYEDMEEAELLRLEELPHLRYGIYSEEMGESGTYHLQGYLQFTRKCTIAMVSGMPGMERAHLAPQRAKSNKKARDYCAKVDDPTFIDGPYEYGEFQGQGARTELSVLVAGAREGKTTEELIDLDPRAAMQFERQLNNVRARKQSKVLRAEPNVAVLYGRTDTGKTYRAFELFPQLYKLRRPNGKNLWWDLYEGEDCVLIDEFYGWLSWTDLLQITDKYPYVGQTKGSHVAITATNFIFTSNKQPWLWYDSAKITPTDFESFVRRVSVWYYYTTTAVYKYSRDDYEDKFQAYYQFKDTVIRIEGESQPRSKSKGDQPPLWLKQLLEAYATANRQERSFHKALIKKFTGVNITPDDVEKDQSLITDFNKPLA